MPDRRRIKKGSFGGHFDELVTQFPHEDPKKRAKRESGDEPGEDDGSIHDRLLEGGWRQSREDQRSRFSNQ